jgi:hypothetical protein
MQPPTNSARGPTARRVTSEPSVTMPERHAAAQRLSRWADDSAA